MDFEVDGEIRIFNEGYKDSRDMRGIARARVMHELSKCVAFTRCYFAGPENLHKM